MLVFLFVLSTATSAVSAVFGMAGGMILMFALTMLLPAAQVMFLHGIAQLASNGYRAWLLRHHIHWGVLPGYLSGLAVAALPAALLSLEPDQGWISLSLGLLALSALRPSWGRALDINRTGRAFFCGLAITTVQIWAGASGPLLDAFYARDERPQKVIVASKALTQSLSHLAKISLYGWLLRPEGGLGISMLPADGVLAAALLLGVWVGTVLGKKLLDRFEHANLREMTRRILFVIGVIFLLKGAVDLLAEAST